MATICTKIQQIIAAHFPNYLFWDVEVNLLELKEDMDFIIPRALYATTSSSFIDDINRLEKLYSPNQIVNALKNTKERISNKLCEQIARRYCIPSFSRFAVE